MVNIVKWYLDLTTYIFDNELNTIVKLKDCYNILIKYLKCFVHQNITLYYSFMNILEISNLKIFCKLDVVNVEK